MENKVETYLVTAVCFFNAFRFFIQNKMFCL